MSFSIEPIKASDYDDWHPLWTAYLDFYHTRLPDSQFKSTFARLTSSLPSHKAENGEEPFSSTTTNSDVVGSVHATGMISRMSDIRGFILRDETGKAQGISHYLFHASAWSDRPHCYLNDLYVTPDSRGKGYGRALIERTVRASVEGGGVRLYWSTAPDNAIARRLYDQLAVTDRVLYKINH